MIPSTITHVTVFTDRARVTRSASVSVAAGVQKIEMGDLPLTLLSESVRVSAQGTARARLLGVSMRIENYADTPAIPVRELQTQEETLKDKLDALDARAAAAKKEQAAIEAVMAQGDRFAREIAKGTRSTEEELAALSRLRVQLAQVQEDALALARQRRGLEKELDKIQRQLQEQGNAQPRQRYIATAEFQVLAPGELFIELKHMVWGAGWLPMYDVRQTDAGLEVHYLAQVTQNSGEDWMKAQLSLSTAQPGLALNIPELEPWYIMPKPPPAPAPPHRMMRTQMLSDSVGGGAMEYAAVPSDASAKFAVEEAVASVSESGPALTYDLPCTADVPGNGEPRKVAVGAFTLKPNSDYITAPKIEAVCYRRVKVKNDSPYTLLSGEAQLFDGDDFLGTTRLELIVPAQEIELALGVDERVRVERKLLQREVDKTFLTDKRRTRLAYKIELENLRKEQSVIIVRDQLPLGKHEEIKIKLESADPKPATHSDLNQLEWKIALPPGGKGAIAFEFTVEHPRNIEVIGLGV